MMHIQSTYIILIFNDLKLPTYGTVNGRTFRLTFSEIVPCLPVLQDQQKSLLVLQGLY